MREKWREEADSLKAVAREERRTAQGRIVYDNNGHVIGHLEFTAQGMTILVRDYCKQKL